MDIVVYYFFTMLFVAVAIYIISAWREPVSLAESIKERMSSVLIAGVVSSGFGLAFHGFDVSKWPITFLLGILVASGISVIADWNLIRRRQKREEQ
jgi:hypothetical protein